jgi:hypothetical protein
MALADDGVSFTDLLRNPKPVVARAERGRVRIHRRDGADLVLSPAEDAANDETAAVARLLALVAQQVSAAELDFVFESAGFGWTKWMPPAARREFAADLLASIGDAASLESYRPINQTVREWKATAAVYADPDLADQLRRPIPKPLAKPVTPA